VVALPVAAFLTERSLRHHTEQSQRTSAAVIVSLFAGWCRTLRFAVPATQAGEPSSAVPPARSQP